MRLKHMRVGAALMGAALVMLPAMPCSGAGEVTDYDDMGMYTVNDSYITFGYRDDGIVITECQKEMKGDLVIPDELDGKPVIAIGEGAFYQVTGLTSVTMPETVTEIGPGAFYCCEALRSVNLPKGLTSIGESAFYQCASLQSVQIPDGITTITDSCFSLCYSLTELTFPKNLEVIEAQAFYGTGQMDELVIPDTVTDIGELAFYYWNRITTVTIPKSVRNMGDYVFDGCDALTEIVVEDGNPAYCDADGVLYDAEMKRLIKYPSAKNGESFSVPDGVTELDGWAFVGASKLRSIELNDVETFGNEAFYNCTALEAITLPANLEKLPDAAFTYCSSLREIVIPESCTAIGTYCFAGCTSLREVAVPAGVTEIGDYAFGYDYDIETQTLSKLKDFRLRVLVGTVGMEYAKEFDVPYRSNSKLGLILGITAAVLVVAGITVGVLLHRRNTVRIADGPNKGKPVAKQSRTNIKNGGK